MAKNAVPARRNKPTRIKNISACFVAVQVALFIALMVFVFYAYHQVLKEGGGFVPGFETIQSRRLIAFVAPYLALPITIALSLLLYKRRNYRAAIGSALVLLCITAGASRLYLKAVPDPITENFGARTTPYPGFLILPADAVPPGFEESKHHYTMREYGISFAKIVDGKRIELGVHESDITYFGHTGSELVRDFTYQGIAGQVYVFHNKSTSTTTYRLIWLNPPKQRISIHLTQTPANDYSPQDLINILKSMNLVR